MKLGPKLTLLAASVALSAAPFIVRAQSPSATNNLVINKDTVGYAIGVNMGMSLTNNLKRANFEVNTDEIVNAIRDILSAKEVKMTDAQARETIMTYQQRRTREVADKNLKAGEAFLAENKTKEGVKTKEITLADGKTAELQYKILNEGSGDSPTANDTVKVNYRGTLIDGTEFDNSAKHGGQPAQFPVGRGIIRGWTEALEMMKPGAKWQLFVPASLAYGEMQRPGIEPGSTLIFDVELVEIVKPTAEAAPAPQKPLTSDIIRVPSAEEMKAGAKIEVIKASDLEKSNAQQQATSPKK